MTPLINLGKPAGCRSSAKKLDAALGNNSLEVVLQPLCERETGSFYDPLGHLQFQVEDQEASYHFFRDKIGLIPSMYAPCGSYGDLGAGGRVAHRTALKTWQ